MLVVVEMPGQPNHSEPPLIRSVLDTTVRPPVDTRTYGVSFFHTQSNTSVFDYFIVSVAACSCLIPLPRICFFFIALQPIIKVLGGAGSDKRTKRILWHYHHLLKFSKQLVSPLH